MTHGFRDKLCSGAPLLGTFLKTPSPILCEVLARSGLDTVCIDAEHAPFDRTGIDACIFALRSAGIASLVRVMSNAPEHILNALDCGADGVAFIDGRSMPNTVSNENIDAECTIGISLENLSALLSGDLEPTTGFMMGKFKVSGDMSVALKLQRVV